MDNIYVYSFLVLIITYFVFVRSAKRQSITINVKGETVIRAAYHTEIIDKVDDVKTLHESWMYVVKMNSVLHSNMQ